MFTNEPIRWKHENASQKGHIKLQFALQKDEYTGFKTVSQNFDIIFIFKTIKFQNFVYY